MSGSTSPKSTVPGATAAARQGGVWSELGFGLLAVGIFAASAMRSTFTRRRFVMLGALAATLLIAVYAVPRAARGSADEAASVETRLADAEKRVASLDAERKKREEQLADLQRRQNAKESELAEGGEQVSKLEQRRSELQRQVTELAGPVSGAPDEPLQDIRATAVDEAAPLDDPSVAPKADAQDSQPQDAVAAKPTLQAPPPAKATPPLPPSRLTEPAPAVSVVAARGEDHERAGEPETAFGPVRVFIHVKTSDAAARSRAQAVAAELRRRGISVAQIRGVRFAVRRDSVRYFYDADRRAVSGLQDAIREASPPSEAAPVAQDYRSYGAPPRPGTLELWLS